MADSQLNAGMSLVSLSVQKCFKRLGVLCSRGSPGEAGRCWGHSGLIQTWGFTKDLPHPSTVIDNECMMGLRKEMSFPWTNFSNHKNKQREKAGGYITIVLYDKKGPLLFEKSPTQHIKFDCQGKLLREQNIHCTCQLWILWAFSRGPFFLEVIISTWKFFRHI